MTEVVAESKDVEIAAMLFSTSVIGLVTSVVAIVFNDAFRVFSSLTKDAISRTPLRVVSRSVAVV